jgi:MFS family permease
MSLSESPMSRRARLKRAAVPEPGPIRTLTKVTLTSAVGNGLFATIEAIFFTRSVGLTNHQVALGLGIAALVGLVVTIPAGHLADRRGPRELIAIFLVLEGFAMAAFVLVHSFGGFVAVAIASSVLRSAEGSAGMALISRFGAGEERVRIRAFQRSVGNLGMSVGMGVAAIALAMDTRAGYVVMVLGNAAAYLVSAIMVMQFPAMEPTSPKGSEKRGRGLVALRDRHFLIATALAGCMAIQFAIQNVGVPLWVVQYTHAPRWWVAVLMLVNTSSVILFQVRFTRGTDDLTFAARTFRRSGLFIATACVLFSFAHGVGAVPACIILTLATMVDVVGELLGSAAGWAIGFGMAVEGLQGQYQGVYALSWGIASIFGPLLVASTALAMGRPGWLILGAMFIVTGAAYPPLIRSHLKERSRSSDIEGELA